MPGRVVTELTRELRIINEKGLHARASAKFVETVERFDARAMVEKDGELVAGNSIMGLLMLVAPRGSAITVTTSGPEAAPLMEALAALVGNYFGEGR
ncbi:phosphate ABC transporter permease [Paracoccus sanguinis]|uniref:Phosphate ABC transporter permease n=1 Tax=Paracoccus sanguinis TaxID=1545044 RepID=A0A099G3I5_9RHOB|nr:phosphate ABC transporter permease [Paracoccus sanguinis]KGJ17394.1 phosphate ABC transporter permease [Paracoccus sanguinis]KGJ20677.1 phosphate ABC transporter permease [Paracoccus sanguinis]KGJ22975.1 phosphate ABC transporter permease [Paracoccus sanguinis]SDW87627.1 phosphocarrier protein [Paracoccus sanguinis]